VARVKDSGTLPARLPSGIFGRDQHGNRIKAKRENLENIEFSQDRYQVVKYTEEFLKWGGFPRITLVEPEARKKEILKDYLEMIIYKDIVERYSVRNPHLLKMIINYVLTNFASEFSMSAFIKKFQAEYSLNKDTIFTYFSYLEEVGFLYYLPRFSYKIHERYSKKKNYIADNGFIALLSFRRMEIPGRLLENLVFTELSKRGKNLFYYRNPQNHECDFIVTENEQVSEAIQVTYGFSSVNREKEIRGLMAALKEFKLPKGIIITNDHEETIRQSSCEINILPFWKWALKG
jgi:hypothetical protein